jgi:putative flippase GtrA
MPNVAPQQAQGLRQLGREFVGYTAASAVALIVDLGTLVFLVGQGMQYLIAATIAFLAGMIVVYFASVKWIFGWRSYKERVTSEISIFLFTGVVGLGINLGILWLGTSVLGIYYLYAKAASVAIVFTWNFLSRKLMLFTSRL